VICKLPDPALVTLKAFVKLMIANDAFVLERGNVSSEAVHDGLELRELSLHLVKASIYGAKALVQILKQLDPMVVIVDVSV